MRFAVGLGWYGVVFAFSTLAGAAFHLGIGLGVVTVLPAMVIVDRLFRRRRTPEGDDPTSGLRSGNASR